MDGLSSATSVIAVIQLTGSLVKICGGYIQEVKDARDDILSLQQAIESLQGILHDLQKMLYSNDGKALPASLRLADNITDCLSDVRALEASLDPGKGKKLMRKVGLRALKWPLKRAEVESMIQILERYKSSFLLSLQVDQTSLMVGVAETTDRMNHNMDLAKLDGAIEAEFDAFSDRNEARCLRGTRVELLQQIMDWALSSSQESCIFWLKGMAGTGKSTISRTVAMSLKETNHLGASFFFKRGEGDRGNAEKFFPTLTRQLIFKISGLRATVQKAFDKDPKIATKSLKEQFEHLLLQPLLDLNQPCLNPQTAVIVIDALDECDHDQDIRTIIRLLHVLQRVKAIRLRIFLTSRPELPIDLGFLEIANHDYQDIALHEIPEEVTQHDIHLFLQDRFAKIKHDRNISEDWPGKDLIQKLVRMSTPLFISAATVCRYIEHSQWEPTRRLAELLQDQSKYVSRMDKTYLPILTRLVDDQESDESDQQQLLQEFQEIIGVIILLAVPLSINALSLFLGTEAGQISNRLNSFRSVFSIPDDQDQPVRILHLSFRDFLVRSGGSFHVDEPKKHKEIAKFCLKTMQSHLRKDICHLVSPGTYRADIDPQCIRQYLHKELRYSCRYWIHHLKQSQHDTSEISNVRLFLQEHFLHWVEALSLLGLISEVVSMLDLLQTFMPGDEFLHDGKRFITKICQIADEAPLQIYCTGLIFAPRASLIREQFQLELPTWVCQLPRVNETWSAELQALEGHSATVRSVALAPDGRLLASGSDDLTVRLWDTATGALQQTLEGHSSYIYSVAFSPDGLRLASGSRDRTVRLWDTVTGALQQTLKGHSPYWSVTFSPDGRLLAAGSLDRTVQLWDTATGALQQTLEGHSAAVRSVAFSPDGQLLASGSDDRTVRLWDTATGAMQQTLDGHSATVLSVAFSPDGRLLASASGSKDRTVRLWDTATGALKQTLEGHLATVWSVTFSPDGLRLASGSSDWTVRLWDTATGTLQQTLEGHSAAVRSVAFSPDGQLLASGSDDRTVRLWDTATGAMQQTIEGHLATVSSMTFSPDGMRLASGSSDWTVRLWDTATGTLQQTLEGHSAAVRSVAFSPDGQLLASGSDDRTVRLWDTATGAMQQTIEGHLATVSSVTFSPDGRLLASASGFKDRTVRLWDTATGALQQTLEGHSAEVSSVAFSPDGLRLASGSRDRTVRLWDTVTGALQQTLKGHSATVSSVAFSPDSRLLASGSWDRIVYPWDMPPGAMTQTLSGHLATVPSVAFSPDGRMLAFDVEDLKVQLWDTVTGALHEIPSSDGTAIEPGFSQDGSCLRTNLGTLKVQSGHENHAKNSISKSPAIFIERNQWINLNAKNMLWLPPDFRPSSFATHGGSLALGHASGRVSFLKFRL
ncbi:hypothetical protein N7448_011267 [Penicillium atrosanguineum]|nr:hypothetical protein N7448_011267 [Penicillium atrosanguineum]